ncbi:hypothetical protein FRC17_008870 [Serendipita sp. 399]|nr:hypothetical protein FRC17_008870 [Serendipita sp. 399]
MLQWLWREYTEVESLALMASAWFGVKTSFSGPIPLVFSILYAYSRAVPSAYRYRIFGLTLSDKTPHYFLASLLALHSAPESLALAAIGLMTGAACRSDLLPFKTYRLPNWVNKIGTALRPLIGSTEPGFRSFAALPELGMEREHEASNINSAVAGVELPESGNAGNDRNAAPRQPTQEEITQLSTMFPNATRVQIVNAITSTTTLEAAVERLIQ